MKVENESEKEGELILVEGGGGWVGDQWLIV